MTYTDATHPQVTYILLGHLNPIINFVSSRNAIKEEVEDYAGTDRESLSPDPRDLQPPPHRGGRTRGRRGGPRGPISPHTNSQQTNCDDTDDEEEEEEEEDCDETRKTTLYDFINIKGEYF